MPELFWHAREFAQVVNHEHRQDGEAPVLIQRGDPGRGGSEVPDFSDMVIVWFRIFARETAGG